MSTERKRLLVAIVLIRDTWLCVLPRLPAFWHLRGSRVLCNGMGAKGKALPQASYGFCVSRDRLDRDKAAVSSYVLLYSLHP